MIYMNCARIKTRSKSNNQNKNTEQRWVMVDVKSGDKTDERRLLEL